MLHNPAKLDIILDETSQKIINHTGIRLRFVFDVTFRELKFSGPTRLINHTMIRLLLENMTTAKISDMVLLLWQAFSCSTSTKTKRFQTLVELLPNGDIVFRS